MKVEGDTIRLKFKNIGGGSLKFVGEKLTGFAIAGEDKKFTWAEARLGDRTKGEGDTVFLKAPGVPNPTAVRYAWANNPEANLYDNAGLPAPPFRTDDWKPGTQGRN